MHPYSLNTPSAPFRLSRLSAGLLAALAHFGSFAGIAVKDGTSVTSTDATVTEAPRLGDDTGIYAIFLDKGSSLTLSANPVTVNAPNGTGVRMVNGTPQLIFGGTGVVNTKNDGISMVYGGRLQAPDLTMNITGAGTAVYSGSATDSTVDVKKLTVRAPTGYGIRLARTQAQFDSLDIEATGDAAAGAVEFSGKSNVLIKKATVKGVQAGMRFLDTGTIADISDAKVTATSGANSAWGVMAGNSSKVTLNGALNTIDMPGSDAHVTGGLGAATEAEVTSNAPLSITHNNGGGALLSFAKGVLNVKGETTLSAVNGAALYSQGGKITQTGKLTVAASKYGFRVVDFNGTSGSIDVNPAERSSLASSSYGVLFSGDGNTINIANTDINAGSSGAFYNPPATAGAPRNSALVLSNSTLTPANGIWLSGPSDALSASVKAGSVVNGRVMAAHSTVSIDASTWNLWVAGIATTKATAQTITYQAKDATLSNGSTLVANAPAATLYDVQAPLTANNSSIQLNNGVVGDVLSTPSYTASASTLALDVTLNAGDAATNADNLKTASVSGGPTTLRVAPSPDSAGAATTGKGILLVQVTGGAPASPADAFVLEGGPITNGGFEYSLVRDASDGNWYLQSKAAATPPAPGPGPSPGPSPSPGPAPGPGPSPGPSPSPGPTPSPGPSPAPGPGGAAVPVPATSTGGLAMLTVLFASVAALGSRRKSQKSR